MIMSGMPMPACFPVTERIPGPDIPAAAESENARKRTDIPGPENLQG